MWEEPYDSHVGVIRKLYFRSRLDFIIGLLNSSGLDDLFPSDVNSCFILQTTSTESRML